MRTEITRRIIADSEVCHGKPVFKGTRILVGDIVELVAAGKTISDIAKSYPSVTPVMVRDALNYAARLTRAERYATFSKVSA